MPITKWTFLRFFSSLFLNDYSVDFKKQIFWISPLRQNKLNFFGQILEHCKKWESAATKDLRDRCHNYIYTYSTEEKWEGFCMSFMNTKHYTILRFCLLKNLAKQYALFCKFSKQTFVCKLIPSDSMNTKVASRSTWNLRFILLNPLAGLFEYLFVFVLAAQTSAQPSRP